MGTAQFLLAAGAQSLVVPRWPLDERSIPIYLEFYRRFEGGDDVAEALAEARNVFLGGQAGDSVLRHPFFWAGIIHVGWPGGSSAKLPTRAGSRQALLLAIVLGGSIGLIWRLRNLRRPPSPDAGGGSAGRCRRRQSSGSGRAVRE